MTREIVIAGAGVSGLTAAINLKRAGRAVRVVERNAVSGAQRFPDWDAVENWTSPVDFSQFLARIGIDERGFRFSAPTTFTVIDPYGRCYDVHTACPLFYLVKRGAIEGGLEHSLQNQAKSLSIPIDYGIACPPGQADIWAVGSYGQGAGFISLGVTFLTNHPDWVCCLVDKNIAPRAYAYLVIVEGEGTIAVVLSQARREAHHLLERAMAAFKQHSDFEVCNARRSGGSGGDAAAFWLSPDDFVIGEAAGFQDFLWGFGIRHALTSGYLAAQTILTNQSWQAVSEQDIRPFVRASLVNRWLYDRMPNWGYALLIRRFARDPDLHGLLSRWYHPRRIHRLLWPFVERRYQHQVSIIRSHSRYQNRTRQEIGSII